MAEIKRKTTQLRELFERPDIFVLAGGRIRWLPRWRRSPGSRRFTCRAAIRRPICWVGPMWG